MGIGTADISGIELTHDYVRRTCGTELCVGRYGFIAPGSKMRPTNATFTDTRSNHKLKRTRFQIFQRRTPGSRALQTLFQTANKAGTSKDLDPEK